MTGREPKKHNDLNGSFIKGFEQMSATAFEPLTMQYDRIHEVSE